MFLKNTSSSTRFEIQNDAFQAALLHDTVEDTDTTIEEIKEEFGDAIAGNDIPIFLNIISFSNLSMLIID